MTMLRAVALLLTCSLSLGACATLPPGPSVSALPGTDKSFAAFEGDDVACRQWAAQQAGTTPQRAGGLTTAEDAGIGTLLGAGLGAALGAIGHNPGLGAAVGAGGGLAAGTVYGAGAGQQAANQVQHRYDAAYEQCMYAKGNQVPGAAAAPAATIPPPPPAAR
jgi:Glycine-zipper domain